MKILKASEIRQADQFTILHEPIASIDLMERASGTCFDWLKSNLNLDKTIYVYCGIGNNGGDGLALARMLSNASCDVFVYCVGNPENGSEDFKINFERWKQTNHNTTLLSSLDKLPIHTKNHLIIDAIFGTGLTRKVEGDTLKVIKHINESGVEVISIDLPSGMYAEDNSSSDTDNIVQADHTLTFQSPKLAFLISDTGEKVGYFHVLDIGLNRSFIESCESQFFYTQEEDISSMLHPRELFSHKGTFGHTLMITGSKGKMGAAILASKSAVKMGAGLVTAFVPECGYSIIQDAVPEAMCRTSRDMDFISGELDWNLYSSIAIGPGIGMNELTKNTLIHLLKNYTKSIVLDADALNLLSSDSDLLKLIPENSILTPHPKEFDRLFGPSSTAYNRLMKQIEMAQKFHIFIVLKGAFTSVATPEGSVYFNSSGNPSLSTGGSGDVLTGMISSLLSQGYSNLESALIGVYLHGLTADLWSSQFNEAPMTAGNIIDNIPAAYKAIT